MCPLELWNLPAETLAYPWSGDSSSCREINCSQMSHVKGRERCTNEKQVWQSVVLLNHFEVVAVRLNSNMCPQRMSCLYINSSDALQVSLQLTMCSDSIIKFVLCQCSMKSTNHQTAQTEAVALEGRARSIVVVFFLHNTTQKHLKVTAFTSLRISTSGV